MKIRMSKEIIIWFIKLTHLSKWKVNGLCPYINVKVIGKKNGKGIKIKYLKVNWSKYIHIEVKSHFSEEKNVLDLSWFIIILKKCSRSKVKNDSTRIISSWGKICNLIKLLSSKILVPPSTHEQTFRKRMTHWCLMFNRVLNNIHCKER